MCFSLVSYQALSFSQDLRALPNPAGTHTSPDFCALQANSARRQEEATSKQASLAAQLKASEEELAAAQKQSKQLQQQLADTRDAVKVGERLMKHSQAKTQPSLNQFLRAAAQAQCQARQASLQPASSCGSHRVDDGILALHPHHQ